MIFETPILTRSRIRLAYAVAITADALQFGFGPFGWAFVDQFIDMASRTRRLANEKNQPHFAEWFAELIEKAEALRGAIPQR